MTLPDLHTDFSEVFCDSKEEGFLLFEFQPEAAIHSLSNCVCSRGIDHSFIWSMDIKIY